MTRKADDKERYDETITQLRKLCPPGSTIYTVLRNVSRSGMSRGIDAYVMLDGEPQWLSGYIGRGLKLFPMATGHKDWLRVGGCGMDMGFHVVYNLAATLYRGGFGCIGEGCPSNDHSNGDRDYRPHPSGPRCIHYHDRCHRQDAGEAVGEWREDREPTGARIFTINAGHSLYLFDDEVDSDEPTEPHWHRDGGYALRHRWM